MVHHHGLDVVGIRLVLLCSHLELVKGLLQRRVVWVFAVDWNTQSAVIHVLPSVRGDCEGVVYKQQAAQRAHN